MNNSSLKESESKGESKNILAITGKQAKINGRIEVGESIEINCDVVGELKVDGKLIIQKDGYVNAEVNTQDAKICGRYEGNMKVKGKVEIAKKGRVKGDITTDSIIINEGGVFSGKVIRISEEKEKKRKKSVPKPKKKKVVEKKVVEKEKEEKLTTTDDFKFDYGAKV